MEEDGVPSDEPKALMPTETIDKVNSSENVIAVSGGDNHTAVTTTKTPVDQDILIEEKCTDGPCNDDNTLDENTAFEGQAATDSNAVLDTYGLNTEANPVAHFEEENITIDQEIKNLSIETQESMPLENERKVTGTTSTTTPSKNTGNQNPETERLQGLCVNMLQKMTVYLHGEVESTVEDYALLERMNKATTAKYAGMFQTAKQVGDSLRSINQRFVDLQPYLDQIESIEQSVLALEQASYKLDSYTKALEERFWRL